MRHKFNNNLVWLGMGHTDEINTGQYSNLFFLCFVKLLTKKAFLPILLIYMAIGQWSFGSNYS